MYAKNLWIVVVEGGPGGTEITAKSAKGLFAKYANEARSETELVVWQTVSADGQVEEKKRWQRKSQSTTATTATGALVNVGLYVVAHGQEGSGQVGGGGPHAMISKLTKAGLPHADKVSFVACYSGQQDKGAIDDDRFRDYDPTAHGLDPEDLSFISMFAVGYQDAYKSTSSLHVAGWESFVSAYHPKKITEVPSPVKGSDIGRKYVSASTSNSYTFMKPKSSSRTNKKRMFRWTFVDGTTSVEKIATDNWKNLT